MKLILLVSLSPVALALSGLHSSLFSKVKDSFGLKLTDFTDSKGMASWEGSNWSGTTQWWDEEKGSKLTGVSLNFAKSSHGMERATLNAWLGPGYSVPHMLLSLWKDRSGEFGVEMDYVVRGPTPIGTDGRYTDAYYNKDVISAYEKVANAPGVKHRSPHRSMSGRLLRSPVHIAVSGLSEESMADAASAHLDQWVGWLLEAQQVESRQRGAMNGRDDKLREFAFKAAMSDCIEYVGPDKCVDLAAAWTGPIAEAYVGGGS